MTLPNGNTVFQWEDLAPVSTIHYSEKLKLSIGGKNTFSQTAPLTSSYKRCQQILILQAGILLSEATRATKQYISEKLGIEPDI